MRKSHEDFRKLVEATPLSRAAIAARLGVAPNTVNNWSSGHPGPPERGLKNMLALAKEEHAKAAKKIKGVKV